MSCRRRARLRHRRRFREHVPNIKTREDPQKVAKFYIDNFGATVKREIPGRGCQLDLHGVQLNVTTIIADQNHEQHVGMVRE
jgi:hypothetical protein